MSVNYGGPPAGGMPYGGGTGFAPRRASLEWINESWRLFSAQAGTWVISCLVAIFLPVVLYFISAALFGASIAASAQGRNGFGAGGVAPGLSVGLIIFVVLFWTAYGLFYMPFIYSGVYQMAVRQVRGQPIGIGDIFGGGAKTLKMLGYQFLYGLMGFIPSVVLTVLFSLLHVVSFAALGARNSNFGAVPDVGGLFVWYALVLVCYGIVAVLFFPVHAQIADGEGVIAAMGRSASAMKTQVLPTFGILCLFGLLYFVSAIPCGLGLFVTIPMFWLMSAIAYRDILGMPGLAAGDGYGQPGFGAPAAPGVWPPAPSAAPPPPPASPYGQAPLPTSFGQTPPPASQTPPPAPSWGQPQPPATPPANPESPRRSLGGEPIDETPPPGGGPQ